MEEKYDPEGWQTEYSIFEEKRWDDLVKLRKKEAEKYKDEEYIQEELGQAYVLAKRYEEAITLLTPYHQKHPNHSGIKNVILDALKELGKDENDFDWKNKPEILRLDEELFEKCLKILKKKRKKKRTFNEIEDALDAERKFMDFSRKELEEWLKKDQRLRFINDGRSLFEVIEIR